jgi:hypothetical protein
VSGLPCPETITVWPYTSGVIEFVIDRASNGTRHRSCPVAASTPTRLFCEKLMTCRVPLKSARIGEPYAGPSPFQLHFTAPVAASKAVSAP